MSKKTFLIYETELLVAFKELNFIQKIIDEISKKLNENSNIILSGRVYDEIGGHNLIFELCNTVLR